MKIFPPMFPGSIQHRSFYVFSRSWLVTFFIFSSNQIIKIQEAFRERRLPTSMTMTIESKMCLYVYSHMFSWGVFVWQKPSYKLDSLWVTSIKIVPIPIFVCSLLYRNFEFLTRCSYFWSFQRLVMHICIWKWY